MIAKTDTVIRLKVALTLQLSLGFLFSSFAFIDFVCHIVTQRLFAAFMNVVQNFVAYALFMQLQALAWGQFIIRITGLDLFNDLFRRRFVLGEFDDIVQAQGGRRFEHDARELGIGNAVNRRRFGFGLAGGTSYHT